MLRKILSIITLLCYILSFIARDAVSAVQELIQPVPARNSLSSCIPPSLGRITSGQYAGSDLVVVTIQDLHCHAEVQHNIARILEYLGKEYRLDRVFVEGATGDVDMSWLAKLQEKAEGREMLDTLMAQGKLTGAEFYALKSGRGDILKGLENEELYQKNFERLVTICGRRDMYEERIRTLTGELAAVKERYFSRQHHAFDALVEKHRDGKLSEDKFYCLLQKYADKAAFFSKDLVGPARTTDILDDYRKVKHEAKRVRFNSAMKELRVFLEETRNKLSYEDYRNLAATCHAWTDQPLFSDTLFRSAEQCHININERYPELSRFAAYVEKSRKINPRELLKEQDRLIHEVRGGLSRNNAELEVSFLCDFLPTFEGYLLNQLSPDEYARFQRLFPEFCLLWEKYTGTPPGPWQDDYALLNAFYDTNIQRNKCFIETLAGEGDPHPALSLTVRGEQDPSSTLRQAKRVVAVVTGGFHTDGMETLLAESGISYITVTPSITTGASEAASIYDEMMSLRAAGFSGNAFALRLLAQVTADVRDGILIDAEVNKASREAERGLAGLLSFANSNWEDTFTTMCAEWNGAYPDIFGHIEFGGIKTEDGKRFVRFIDKKTHQILTFEITGKGGAVFTGVENTFMPARSKGSIPVLKRAITRKAGITLQKYDQQWGPVIEEILFTGLPLAAAAFIPSLFVPVLVGARLVFIALHLNSEQAPADIGIAAVVSILTLAAVFVLPHSIDFLPITTAVAAFIHMLANNRSRLDHLFYYGPFSCFSKSDKCLIDERSAFISSLLLRGLRPENEIKRIAGQLSAKTLPLNGISLFKNNYIELLLFSIRRIQAHVTFKQVIVFCAIGAGSYIFNLLFQLLIFQNIFIVTLAGGTLFHFYHEWISTYFGNYGHTLVSFDDTVERLQFPSSKNMMIVIPSLSLKDDVLLHEIIHILYRYGLIRYHLPLASAFQHVQEYRMKDFSIGYEKSFIKGRHIAFSPESPAVKMEYLISPFCGSTKPYKDKWRSFINPDEEYPWTYQAGALIGGYAQGISDSTGIPDDAWEYLRLLSFGIYSEIAEEFLHSRKDAARGDNVVRKKLFKILSENEETRYFTELAFSILSKDQEGRSLLESYLEERGSVLINDRDYDVQLLGGMALSEYNARRIPDAARKVFDRIPQYIEIFKRDYHTPDPGLRRSFVEEMQLRPGKAVLPFLRKAFVARFSVRKEIYENIIAPILEELIFTGIPLAAGMYMPALFPLFFTCSRVTFVLLHLMGRTEEEHEKYGIKEFLFMPALLSACLIAGTQVVFSLIPFVPFAASFMTAAFVLHVTTNAFIHPWINRVFWANFFKADIGRFPTQDTKEQWGSYSERVEVLAGIEYRDAGSRTAFEKEMKSYLAGYLQQIFKGVAPREEEIANEMHKRVMVLADVFQSLLPRWREKGMEVKSPEKFPIALLEVARMAVRKECGVTGELKNYVPNLPDGFGVDYPTHPGFRMPFLSLYRADMSLSEKYAKDGFTVALVLRDMKDGLGDLTKMELLIEQLPPVFARQGITKVNFKVFALGEDENRLRNMMSRFHNRPDVPVIYVIGTNRKILIPAGHPCLNGVDLLLSVVWPIDKVVEYPVPGEKFVPVCMTLSDYNKFHPVNLATKPDVRTRNVEIPTGFGGLGFYVDPRVKELKRWSDALSSEQRRVAKKSTASALFAEMGAARQTDASRFNGFVESVSGSRWALIYLHYTAEFYIRALLKQYQADSAGNGESVTLFTFFSGHNVHDPRKYKGERGDIVSKDEFAALQSRVKKSGMKNVQLYDLSKDLKIIDSIDFSKPGIRVINLGVRSYPLFLKMMALSDLPIGVTGDESLLAALILGKPFVYEYYVLKSELFQELVKFFGFIRGGQKVARMLEAFKEGSTAPGDVRLNAQLENALMPDPERDAAFRTAGDVLKDEAIYENIAALSLKLIKVDNFFDRAAARYEQHPVEATKPEMVEKQIPDVKTAWMTTLYIPFRNQPVAKYFHTEGKYLDPGKINMLGNGPDHRNEIENYLTTEPRAYTNLELFRRIVARYGKVVEATDEALSENRLPSEKEMGPKKWGLWKELVALMNTPDSMGHRGVLAYLFQTKLGPGAFEKCDELLLKERGDIAETMRQVMLRFPLSIALIVAISEYSARYTNGANGYAVYSGLVEKVIYDIYSGDEAGKIRAARGKTVKEGVPRIGITFVPSDMAGYMPAGKVCAMLPGNINEVTVPLFIQERLSHDNVEVSIVKPEGLDAAGENAYLGAAAAAIIEEISDNYYWVEKLRLQGKYHYNKSRTTGFHPGAVITTEGIFQGMSGSSPWRSLAKAPVIIPGERVIGENGRYRVSLYDEYLYSASPDLKLISGILRQKHAEQIAKGYDLIVAFDIQKHDLKMIGQTGNRCSVMMRNLSVKALDGDILPVLLAKYRVKGKRFYGSFRVEDIRDAAARERITIWTGLGRFYGAEIDFSGVKELSVDQAEDWLKRLRADRPKTPFMVKVPAGFDEYALRQRMKDTLITVEAECKLTLNGTGNISTELNQAIVIKPESGGEAWNSLRSLTGGPFIVEIEDAARGTMFDKTELAAVEHIMMIVGLLPDTEASLAEEVWQYKKSDLPGPQFVEELIAFSQRLNDAGKSIDLPGSAGLRLRKLSDDFVNAGDGEKQGSAALLGAYTRALSERMLFEQWLSVRNIPVSPEVNPDTKQLFAAALYRMRCNGDRTSEADLTEGKTAGGSGILEWLARPFKGKVTFTQLESRALAAARKIIDKNPAAASFLLEPFINPKISITDEVNHLIKVNGIYSILTAA